MDRVRESGVEFPESLMLRKHLDAVNEWLARAQAALEGSVQLRELEKLLAEAEKLAVEPGPKLPELQAKMDKALGWLEKVRKAVPKQRSTRRTMDTEVEKVRWNYVFCKRELYSCIRVLVLVGGQYCRKGSHPKSGHFFKFSMVAKFPSFDVCVSAKCLGKEAIDKLGYAVATFGHPGRNRPLTAIQAGEKCLLVYLGHLSHCS